MTFAQSFRADGPPLVAGDPILGELEMESPGFESFMRRYSGCSFELGLYRVHEIAEIRRWTGLCLEAFPSFENRIVCFASDWLGRQFALDFARVDQGERLVLMMEPGTGEALEIPVGFMEFHDSELVNDREAALADSFYQLWLNSGGTQPDQAQCIGYTQPLFLGGKDDISNLERTDMEVYWSICGELMAQTRDLPPGTPVGNVSIE